MRVLHVIPSLAARTGGPAVSVVESSVALRDAGAETTILATDMSAPASAPHRSITSEELPEGARELDVRLHRTRTPHRLAFAPSMWPVLRREAPAHDVVHVHSLFLWPQYAAYQQAVRHRKPFVVSPCGALDPYLRQRGRARKRVTELLWQDRMLRRAAVVHFKSSEEARQVSDMDLGSRAEVVPNGIRWQSFQGLSDDGTFRRRWLAGHAGPVILNLGRLSHKKGLDTLVQAFALVLVAHPDARLVLAGPDDEGLEPSLVSLAATLGVADRVTFTGMLDAKQKREALIAASVWALPTRGENFALAVVEALAVGVPVVVSPALNLAGDIDTADAGVVAAAEPEAFARELSRLLDDEERRQRLSAAARAFARRYDWSSVAQSMLQMYSRAVAR